MVSERIPSPTCDKTLMNRRRGHGGQPVSGIPEREEPEVSMGETHETKMQYQKRQPS